MTSLPLKQRIFEDMKSAMRAKDKVRLSTIRMLMAAIHQREIDERITLDESKIFAVIEKMIKQQQDASAQYQKAGREELADKENFEISVLKSYLPEQLTTQEIDEIINDALAATQATSMRDMGKVMATIKPKVQGRADMGEISNKLKARLAAK